jgi:hypothetical protein
VGGPIGGVIGAIGGAIIGAIGFGGRMAAENYYSKQVKPHLDATDQAFSTGAMDYLTAYSDIGSLEAATKQAISKMGPSAGAYYGDTIKPKLDREMAKLTREARGGRAQFSVSAAQFHNGGEIGGFGDFATGADEGFIHARRGEIVMHQQAAQTNAPLLSAMNSGLDYRDMMPSRMQPLQQRDVNLHFHSPDAKGAHRFLMDNMHSVRAALNGSYGENAGGSDVA